MDAMTDEPPPLDWQSRVAQNRAGLMLSLVIVFLGIGFALAVVFRPWESVSLDEVSFEGDQSSASPYPLRIDLPQSPVMVFRLSDIGSGMVEMPIVEQEPDSIDDAAIDALESSATSGGGGARFSEAFREFGAASPPRQRPNANSFLDVDYDISSLEPVSENYNRSDGSLTVQKPLFVDGKSSGAATIRIEEGAQILIATSSIAQALGERTSQLPRRITGALAKGTGFIPFYELRGAGIDVAYDPVKDQVSLSLPT